MNNTARQISLPNETLFLRRIYLVSFALRFLFGLVGWLATEYLDIELLQDAMYYEQIGANIANDWSNGRSSTWLAIEGKRTYQPVLMVTIIASFYMLTFGVRVFPLLLAFYGALTALTPVLTFRIARQLGASPSAARMSAWLVVLTPAFVFFSGALYKEGFILLFLNLAIYHALRLQATWKIKSFIILGLSLLGLSALRLYLMLIVGLGLGILLLVGRTRSCSWSGVQLNVMKKASLVMLFALVVATVGFTSRLEGLPTDVDQVLGKLQNSRLDLDRSPSGYLHSADISTPQAALRFLPLSLTHFLGTPFPWQTGSFRQNLAILDTSVWLLLYPVILVGMIRALRLNFQSSAVLIAITVAICCFYALLVGNIGTAYRLRIQVWLIWAPFAGVGWEAFKARSGVLREPHRLWIEKKPTLAASRLER